MSATLERPPGTVAMAVMLYPPHLAFVLILCPFHTALHRRWYRGRLGRCAEKYHVLVGQYEKPFWWWSSVVTSRQMVLVFCLTLGHAPERQALVAILCCCANSVGVLLARPYRDERCNAAEASGQLLLVSLILVGLLNPTDLTLIDPSTLKFENDTLVSIAVLVLSAGFGVLAASLISTDIANSQLLVPWWLKLLRIPFDIAWGLISRLVCVCVCVCVYSFSHSLGSQYIYI